MKRTIFLLYVSLVLPTFLFAQIPTDGLVGYWPFNGNANEESGNLEHGIVNNVTLTENRFGEQECAYYFNGSDSYIDLGNNISFKNFTLSIWFKADTFPTESPSDYHTIISSISNNHPDFRGMTMQIRKEQDIAIAMGDGNSWNDQISSTKIDLNVWNHITYLYDSEKDTTKLFLNGNLEFVYHQTGFIEVDSQHVFIGARPNDQPVYHFDGIIDDVRIYNRVLNNNEISSIYNNLICSEIYYDTIPVYDTIYTTVQDTSVYQVFDTVTVTKYDTVQIIKVDTSFITVFDTISVTDTLYIDALLTQTLSQDIINTIKIFPNPTKDYLYINTGINEKMSGYMIRIYNQGGVEVYETEIREPVYEINLSNWTGTGIYFVHIIDSKDEIIVSRKIIIH